MHPRLSNQRVVNSMFSVLGMLFSAAYACGQTEPQLIPRSAEEQKAQFEAHRRIRLAAIITDQSGAVVTGLKEKEFTVFENGTSRPILRFTEVTKGDAAKAHGLIVVDGLNDGLSALHRQEKEIKEFLNHTRTLPFPVAIDVVSEGGVSEGLASTDPAMLVRDLDERTSHVEGNDCGTTHPGSDLGSRMSGGWQPLPQSTSGWAQADCRIGHFNASMIALNQIFAREAKAQGRAIVIWLGPGWPLPPEQDRGQAMPTSNGGGARDMVTVLSTDIQVGQVEFDAVSWGEFARQKGVGRTNAVADISTSSQTEQEKMQVDSGACRTEWRALIRQGQEHSRCSRPTSEPGRDVLPARIRPCRCKQAERFSHGACSSRHSRRDGADNALLLRTAVSSDSERMTADPDRTQKLAFCPECPRLARSR